jgi:SAM-dependent MidA family methyltransferase
MTQHDERWTESKAELLSRIRDEILVRGPIRFDRFMEMALYDPDHGYYRAPESAPGRTGDFITAPEAHPIFGATLAGQIVAFDSELGSPSPFTIIEYGAGGGLLIRPLLAELRQQHPSLYERIQYTPVELNTSRLAELQAHLSEGGHGDCLQSKVPEGGVTGCIIANEFVDAFPVRRIVRQEHALNEIHVAWNGDWFVEMTIPVDDPIVLEYLTRHQFELSNGDVIEIHPGIESWIHELERSLRNGFALIIDYGYPASELFADHRRHGTLKAYFQHGVSNEYYRGIGRQDLTAHVNFSELGWHASKHGFTLERIQAQAELLEQLGLGERMVNLQQNPDLTADDYLAVRAAVLRMIDPGAMGRFRVMLLSRGVEQARE